MGCSGGKIGGMHCKKWREKEIEMTCDLMI